MGNKGGEYATLCNIWQSGMVRNFTSNFKRRIKSLFKINRSTSNRNKTKVYTENLHAQDVSGRIQRKGINDKRCCNSQELEAFEINLNDIVKIDFTTEYIETYDLKVEFNENYIVSENNIKVHNSGKSYMLCYWLTTMCIAYPDTAWGLGLS